MTSAVGTTIDQPQSVDDVRTVMLDAISRDEPMHILGADTWHNAGAPIHATRIVSLAAVSGIVAYVPGDLTITALAGTTLAELAHVTAAHGQWIGLDPAGARGGTIGATVATGSSGPLSHAFGTPRDLVLGLDAVTGYGDVVRAGGRVVKNVAGFDLVRLYTGSWGTLGAITSLTMRLRALPVHDVTLAISIDGAVKLSAVIHALRQGTVSLMSNEWIDAATASSLEIGDGRDVLLLRLGGNDAFVRGQRGVLNAIATTRECEPAVWGRLSALDRDAGAVVRVSGAVSTLAARVARLREQLSTAGARDIAMHGSVHSGTVRLVASGDVTRSRTAMQQVIEGETRVLERAPASWWSTEHDAFRGVLPDRIRDAFDPKRLCNRRKVTDA